jgi:formylglycine-generating enzyme required for sulfatase activity
MEIKMKAFFPVALLLAILLFGVLFGGCGGSLDQEDADDHSPLEYYSGDDSDDEADDEVEEVWEDATSGLMWQKYSDCCYRWDDAKTHCQTLNWGGYADWRLPFISEFRSLIRGCDATETGGSCGVTDRCLYELCQNDSCDDCRRGFGPADGCYWPPEINGHCSYYWSSSAVTNNGSSAWYVNFYDGLVSYDDVFYGSDVRCVRDDDDDNVDDDADEGVDDDVDDDADDDADDDDDSDDDADDDVDDMVFIPAGNFQMGCEPEDGDCEPDESPRHEVWLSAYSIDTYEVTNARYAAFLTWHGNDCGGGDCVLAWNLELRLSESGGIWTAEAGFEDHPLVLVTWIGAKTFCMWQGKRLPTEAQWEKAAKGAAEHYIYPWGDAWVANAANGDPFETGDYPSTTPVGYYDGSDHDGAYQTTDGRSPYGAHDMAGNVYEWVSDWYLSDYYDEYLPGAWPADPQGPVSGMARRVLRGGGWRYSGSLYLRTSNRVGGYTFATTTDTGFRCSRD